MKPKKRKNFLDKKKRCVFEPRKLWEISKKAIGHPTEEAFEIIIDALDKEYPGYIKKKQNWIFNNAGGAMGQMSIHHGSLREYIILFGTSIGTDGHSGRYKAEVYDFVFEGEMLCEYEGRFKPEVHKPGSPAYLPASIIKHYRVTDKAWMLEYARGNIISMLPFGFADSIFSALDHITVMRVIWNYGKLVIKNMFKKGKDIGIVIKWVLIIVLGIWAASYGIPWLISLLA
ncbi:MAG: ERG2 family protein [Promethearchaeota archaeon]